MRCGSNDCYTYQYMRGTVVGVLRGGPSREHDVSLKTGAALIAHLPPERFTVRDLYIDRAGVWYDRGRAMSPMDVLRTIDVALIGLHGEYGEDGSVQKVLDHAGVPYAGSGSFGSYLAMHKAMAKKHAKDAGLMTPRDVYIESLEDAERGVREAIRTFHQPVVVKPVAWGSSIGVSLEAGYAPVLRAVEQLFAQGAQGVLVEERIRGVEATVGVVEGLRGDGLYLLPPVEIVPPPNAGFFSHGAKYDGHTSEVCPGRFSRQSSEELMRQAEVAHTALGLRHYSRSDFIVSERGIYFLETNTLPGLTSDSLLPKSLSAVGVPFPDFVAHLVGLALNGR